MNAFVKTLIGDARNVSVVAAVLLLAFALSTTGHAAVLAFAVPPLTLVGVAWLARH